jgi:cytochrome oxidase Cu insertion factor (SCO1/SenC/PrrC family)|nr:hypothetical protein [Kofleriaceae bacterium]
MRTALVSLLVAAGIVVAACGGPPKKTADIAPTGSASDTCCCKSTPMTSDDGKPVYEGNLGRMECSTKQGECVSDVQCNGNSQ